ncbi:nitrate reductase NapD [Bradyrhizobium sp. LB1.3]
MEEANRPSRRSLILGRLAEPVVHISSAVVSTLPHRQDEIVRKLADLPEVEVHHRSPSKIVVVMEAADSGVLGSRLAEIATWPGVLSANMVFEQVEHSADIGD